MTIARQKRAEMAWNNGEMTVSESSEKTEGKPAFSALERGRRISVAPMMDYTDSRAVT